MVDIKVTPVEAIMVGYANSRISIGGKGTWLVIGSSRK